MTSRVLGKVRQPPLLAPPEGLELWMPSGEDRHWIEEAYERAKKDRLNPVAVAWYYDRMKSVGMNPAIDKDEIAQSIQKVLEGDRGRRDGPSMLLAYTSLLWLGDNAGVASGDAFEITFALGKYRGEGRLPEIAETVISMNRLGLPADLTDGERKAIVERLDDSRRRKRGYGIITWMERMRRLGIPYEATEEDFSLIRERLSKARGTRCGGEILQELYDIRQTFPQLREPATTEKATPPLKEFRR